MKILLEKKFNAKMLEGNDEAHNNRSVRHSDFEGNKLVVRLPGFLWLKYVHYIEKMIERLGCNNSGSIPETKNNSSLNFKVNLCFKL